MFAFGQKTQVTLMAFAMSALVTACDLGSSNDNTSAIVSESDAYKEFEISVTNLTNAQPLSPLALAFHEDGMLFQVGEEASVALETLAESGDNTDFLADGMISQSAAGTGLIMPGMSETIMVTLESTDAELLTIATMLVNTNDAFTGVNALDLSDLMAGESISLETRSYDSGTEANSELASTIPGPAGGGEGFNSERDDVDFVSMHAGVVSSDDGLTQSALTQAHRFNSPTAMISISRSK